MYFEQEKIIYNYDNRLQNDLDLFREKALLNQSDTEFYLKYSANEYINADNLNLNEWISFILRNYSKKVFLDTYENTLKKYENFFEKNVDLREYDIHVEGDVCLISLHVSYGHFHRNNIGAIVPSTNCLFDCELYEVFFFNENDYGALKIQFPLTDFLNIFIEFIRKELKTDYLTKNYSNIISFFDNPSKFINRKRAERFKKNCSIDNITCLQIFLKIKSLNLPKTLKDTQLESVKHDFDIISNTIKELHAEMDLLFLELRNKNFKLPLNKVVDLKEDLITKKNVNIYNIEQNYGAFIEVYDQARSINNDKIDVLSLKILYLLHTDYVEYLKDFAARAISKRFDSFVEDNGVKSLKEDLTIIPHFQGSLIHKLSFKPWNDYKWRSILQNLENLLNEFKIKNPIFNFRFVEDYAPEGLKSTELTKLRHFFFANYKEISKEILNKEEVLRITEDLEKNLTDDSTTFEDDDRKVYYKNLKSKYETRIYEALLIKAISDDIFESIPILDNSKTKNLF